MRFGGSTSSSGEDWLEDEEDSEDEDGNSRRFRTVGAASWTDCGFFFSSLTAVATEAMEADRSDLVLIEE
jgi:hypothetical protein